MGHSKTNIFFRADGNSHIGLGHVIRSMALLEMLQEDFDCCFLIRQPSKKLTQYIEEAGVQLYELPDHLTLDEEADFLGEHFLSEQDCFVLDGYHFLTNYQQKIKAKVKSLVCIDDIYSCHFVADAIINHIGGISPSDYQAESYTQFYLGMQYALLRKPFRKASSVSANREPAQEKVFVCLGGADPKNDTLNVLMNLEDSSFFKSCALVLGSSYQHRDSLEKYLAETRHMDVEIFSNLGAEEMCQLMGQCAVAVTPPSSVSYEYLSVGGLLYLQKIAANQNKVYDYLVSNQMAYSFDSILSHQEILIHHRDLKTKNIFDGQQEEKFRAIFKDLVQ